jgi:Dynamin family
MSIRATLHDEVEALFAFARDQCEAHAELRPLHATVDHWRDAVHQPMRVAFVGRTNAGKSTMMNAFMGEELAPTGNGELTFNVCWFRHGERRQLIVHMVDGSVEDRSFESLAELAVHGETDRAWRERIRYLEVRCPNPLLRTFDLIDTPGLHSFFENDSRNTRQLLNDRHTRPHAVVFLFSGALQEPDLRELERFHAGCGNLMSGMTAIGALTRVDEWPNAFDDAEQVIRQLEDRHPQVRRSFYTVVPVIGPMGFGAQTLTVRDREVLAALRGLGEPRCQRLLRDVSTFCDREFPGEPAVPPAADRRRLFERLGRFAILRAIAALDRGQPGALADELLRASNVQRLRSIVTAHFGHRAYLIKARSALAAVRSQAFEGSERLAGSAAETARRIAGRIDGIVANEQRFREFALLERHYAGRLALADGEVRELLEVTGERGTSCAARLGAPDDAAVEQLLELAAHRERAWTERAYEPFVNLEVQELARILADSYGDLRARLAQAQAHLQAARDLLSYDDGRLEHRGEHPP